MKIEWTDGAVSVDEHGDPVTTFRIPVSDEQLQQALKLTPDELNAVVWKSLAESWERAFAIMFS